jgi:hypothetical protein
VRLKLSNDVAGNVCILGHVLVLKRQHINGSIFLNRNRISIGVLATCAAASVLTAGCGGEKPFAKVNGQVITKDEYVQALEQTLAVTGAQGAVPVPAGRMVLEQLIGRKIILSEAATQGVLPSDDDVSKAFRYRKDMLEQSQPGKTFEEELQKQGTTPEALKENIKAELAEVALLVKQLNIGNDKVQQYYNEHKEEFGLPARIQVRMILLPPNGPQFAEVQKTLADPKNFTEKAARELNVIPQLKVSAGLQVLPTAQIPPTVAGKVNAAAPGQVIGPVDWPMQGGSAKAWLKIEKKLPQYSVPIDQAAPIARQRVVYQMQAMNDANFSKVRNEIIKKKFDASVETSSPVYDTIWKSVKQSAQDAGIGVAPAPGAAPAPTGGTPPLPGGTAPSAPGGAAAPK